MATEACVIPCLVGAGRDNIHHNLNLDKWLFNSVRMGLILELTMGCCPICLLHWGPRLFVPQGIWERKETCVSQCCTGGWEQLWASNVFNTLLSSTDYAITLSSIKASLCSVTHLEFWCTLLLQFSSTSAHQRFKSSITLSWRSNREGEKKRGSRTLNCLCKL